MKVFKAIGLAVILLPTTLYFILIFPGNRRETKKERAEMHLLYVIETGIIQLLEKGESLPTNHLGLSNAVRWSLLIDITKDNGLPNPENFYSVLKSPIYYSDRFRTGFVFLVRSESYKGPSRNRGRWALVGSSNRVFRTWLPEKDLMPEIRSQLRNELNN